MGHPSSPFSPSPGFAGYFPMNGEEVGKWDILPSPFSPSPGFAGYFPLNGEEVGTWVTLTTWSNKGRRPGGSQGGVLTLT